MRLLPFPKYIYKGNSVNAVFEINDANSENGEYVFKVGDLLRVGIKYHLEDTEYILYKEFTITEEGTQVAIQFTATETDVLPNVELGQELKGVLEIELEYNNGGSINTVYQNEITFKGVVINE